MRIDRLRLIAYGPFTDVELDFTRDHGALHLVFGPNEAGKSSALRALRGLLFGIPVRTADSFRHTHPKLRIGACLTRSDGQRIAFVRRKGQRKTLRGEDDRSLLDESTLHPFLGGVDQAFFEQMFAIGHGDLVQGGEEIVAGGGSVGQALFAAGAGLIQLQTLQQRLAGECEALFKSTGKKPRINQTLSLLKQTRQNEKSARLQAKTWQAHHTALDDARQRLEVVQQALADKRQRQGFLERVAEALPLMARRQEIEALWDTYAGVPELPANFRARRRETEYRLKTAANDLSRAQSRVQELRKQSAALEVPEEVLAHAPLVEALQHELGSFDKARQDRPRLEARMRLLYQQADTSLSAALPPGGENPAGMPEMPAALVAEIQELGQTHERLQTRWETAEERRRQLDAELDTLTRQQEALTPLPDIAALKNALQTAQDAGPLDKQLAEARSNLAAEEADLKKALQRQTLWSGDLEKLENLALPARESIDRHEECLNSLAATIEKQAAEKAKKKEELSRIAIELRSLSDSGDLPTEENLKQSRALREQGWQLVRRRLEGRGATAAEEERFTARIRAGSPLPEAFEASVRRADQIVDRLRREADQVSRRNLLEARQTQYNSELQAIADDLASSRKARADQEQRWQQLWAPAQIEPASTREMRAWLAGILSIRDKLDGLRRDLTRADQLSTETHALKAQLGEALRLTGQSVDTSLSLTEQIATARAHVTRQERRRMQIEATEKERLKQGQVLGVLQDEMAALEDERRAWRRAWSRKVAQIGLKGDASPRVAAAVIERLRAARSQRGEADILRKRIQGIDRDARAFHERVMDLAADLAPELRDEPVDRTAQFLYARLTDARESQATRQSLQQQLTRAEEVLGQAHKSMDDATAMMQTLCREACCEQPERLLEVEQRAGERRQLKEELEALESRLRALSAGATIAAFIEAAAAIDSDRITADRVQLAEDIEAFELERAALNQTIGTERAELKRMDGRATAAGHAEEAERLLAGLEADVENYARLRLASAILARTIEQYRAKHQGPLIQRASDLFARMTTEAFRGVRTEYDQKGQPVLVGLRSGSGEQVGVEGLSDGTADQLYLALRLASIEQYLDASEPLPFVADDLLLRFDDQRSAATLNVLAELSDRTQVIFFTHHQHMVELARQTLPDQVLQIHRL